MYQALYRKWRPQTFDQVIGQQHITETLKNQVKNGRLSHAYLFIGTRGTGKTTCARILARAVNCEHPENGNPCGKCPACRGILEGSVMDEVELDAASNNGVDNVRALREEAVFSPSTVKKRVYIIDEVHMLSMPAFNALLKILEEPPEHLMFILATTELQKVPATILSRCQRHSFRRLDAETIASYLLDIAGREKLMLEKDAADLIARLSDGGVRDALSLLDQCSMHARIDTDAVYSSVGLAGKRRISELLDAVLKHDTAKALQLFSGMWMDGKDPASVLKELSGLLRDVMMIRVAPKAGLNLISGGFEERTLQYFGKRMTTETVVAAMDTIQNTLSGLRDVNNPRTAAELCLVSLSCHADGDSIAGLRARISRLEEQVESSAIPQPTPTIRPQPPEEEISWEDMDLPAEEDENAVFFPEPMTEEAPEEENWEEPIELPVLESMPPLPETSPSCPEEKQPETENGSTDWEQIRDATLPLLPVDTRILLDDPDRVSGRIEGNVLIVEAQTEFVVKRFQKPDVAESLMKAARKVCGRELRVQVGLKPAGDRPTRSLEDLKQFKEVHFIPE